jgi:peptidoglycan/LPS O-acetylase OafA/YrhL
MGNLAALSGLRGFAAAWVVVFHWFALAGPRLLYVPHPLHPGAKLDVTSLLVTGWMGVHIFFALSAFLLSYPFIAAAMEQAPLPNLKQYFRRRLLRILPAYYFQIVVLLLLATMGLWRVGSSPSDVSAVLLHVFMLQGVSHHTAGAVNAVYWTLPVEIGYYILLPLFVIALTVIGRLRLRHGVYAIILCLLLVQVLRHFAFTDIADRDIHVKAWRLGQLDTMADIFVAGTIASWAYYVLRDHPVARSIASYLLIAMGFAGFLILGAIIHRNVSAYWSGSVLMYATSLIGALSASALVLGFAFTSYSKHWTLGFGSAPMQWLGARSFGLYLWHDPVLKWTHHGLRDLGVQGDLLWPLLLIGAPLGLLAAELSYRLVELPFHGGQLPWRRSAPAAPLSAVPS